MLLNVVISMGARDEPCIMAIRTSISSMGGLHPRVIPTNARVVLNQLDGTGE